MLTKQVETLRQELNPVAAPEEPVKAASEMPSAMVTDEEAADLAPPSIKAVLVSSDTDIIVDSPGALPEAPAVTTGNVEKVPSGEAEGDVAAPSTGTDGKGEDVAPNINAEVQSLAANSGAEGDCVAAITEPQVELAAIASTTHK